MRIFSPQKINLKIAEPGGSLDAVNLCCANAQSLVAAQVTLIVRHKRVITEVIYMSKYFVWFLTIIIFEHFVFIEGVMGRCLQTTLRPSCASTRSQWRRW